MDRAISSDYSTKQPSYYETENSEDNASTARFGASLKQVKVSEATSTVLPHQHDEGVSSSNSLANSSIAIATATNQGEFDEDSEQYVSQKVEEIKKKCMIVPLKPGWEYRGDGHKHVRSSTVYILDENQMCRARCTLENSKRGKIQNCEIYGFQRSLCFSEITHRCKVIEDIQKWGDHGGAGKFAKGCLIS